ncbi:MAG: electron transfer flavoprotein subunit beta/FixA family protein [Deltaproteobacteria bacterium]|nr:electron transfer flavoprotein subunit beta/FixA family protein [Deltaproteobacteria bacterium]
MKIAVLVKSVPDTAVIPEIGPNGVAVVTGHLDFVLNPFDEYAVEAALQMKQTHGAEVTALSLGGEEARQALRAAFAMGIEIGVQVRPPRGAELTGRGIALCLAQVLRNLAPDLILAGKQAVDGDGAQVAERLAEHLGYLHASAVTRLALENGRLTAHQAFEEGQLVLEMPLPAVITTEKGINEPRYPTLPRILKARRMEIQELDAGLSDARLEPGWRVERISIPRPERHRRLFSEHEAGGVEHLIGLLQQKSRS